MPLPHRVQILRYLAEEAKRPDLVLEPLAKLFRREDAGDLDIDPLVRDEALALTLDGFLDPEREAVQRSLFLSWLVAADADAAGDAIVLALQDEGSSELLGRLSPSVLKVAGSDRPLAVQLFERILATDGLAAADARIVLQHVARLEGPDARQLLKTYAARADDPELRELALALSAE